MSESSWEGALVVLAGLSCAPTTAAQRPPEVVEIQPEPPAPTQAAPEPAPPEGCAIACDGVAPAPPEMSQRGVRAPRATTLLLTELPLLEKLLAATPARDVDRPRLSRRLADAYVELAEAFVRDGEPPAKAAAARRAAIKHYGALANDHADWCLAPNNPPEQRGCRDEHLFVMGQQQEALALPLEACASYRAVVAHSRQSPFAALACERGAQLR